MLAGLVMSTSLPHAFESRGLAFAGAYVFMQVARCIFMLWALKHYNAQNYLNFIRITSWLALSGVFWIGGAFAEGETRFQLWLIALFLEYLSPSIGFWMPVLGRSVTSDWDIDGHHFAERCGLFIIIALGESILVTGMTFTDLAMSPDTVAAFVVAFVGSVAMWWIYFDIGADRGSHRIAHSKDPGRLARLAYTYMHLPIVAGIVVTAVADELILEHPSGDIDVATASTLLGGTALYLVGNILFKRSIGNTYPLSHLAGLALAGALILAVPMLTPLQLGAAVTTVLIVVGIWERASLGQALGLP
jgi:low temperature requirement protein LtrA